jgi:hypothetical protein
MKRHLGFLICVALSASCAAQEDDPARDDQTGIGEVGGAEGETPPGPSDEPQPLLKAGLHPDASDALRAIGITADGISQTLGSAPASAGTHAADGEIDGVAFSAAVDLRTGGLTTAQIHARLEQLGLAGFAAWYRSPGSDGWSGAAHIHAIWVNVPIKRSLRDQVHDYCNWRNGLVSHSIYTFHRFSQAAIDVVRARFLANNPTNG